MNAGADVSTLLGGDEGGLVVGLGVESTVDVGGDCMPDVVGIGVAVTGTSVLTAVEDGITVDVVAG